MTFDPRRSAREKTSFGNFQLHPTHLATAPVTVRKVAEPKKVPRSVAEQRQARADRARQAREARWVAAGCRPLAKEEND